MSIYSYPQSKVIDQVTFRKTTGGAHWAYLHLKDGVDPALPQAIAKTFRDRHWLALPTSQNGKPELEILGCRNESQLINELRNNNWVSGTTTYKKDNDHKPGFVEQVKKRSLPAASLLYFLGDYKFFSYGRKEGNALDMAGGVAYFLGSLSSFLFGRKDASDLQIQDLSHKMAEYANAQNITLPEGVSLNSIVNDHQKGLLRKTDDLLRRYPAELMNTFFGIAGLCIATAAYKKLHVPVAPEAVEQYVAKQLQSLKTRFPHTQLSAQDLERLHTDGRKLIEKMHHVSSKLDIGLGSLTAASGTIATLIPEKTHDPDAPKAEGVQAAWEWLQEHPMSIAGVGYMIATLCHAASTAIEYKVGTTDGKKAIFDRGVFVLTNLMAELLVSISSKGHGQGVVSDTSVDSSIIAVAADLIARQPPEMQNQLIEYMAGFLGRPDVLAMKDEEVTSLLRHEVEAMRNNPWAQAVSPKKVYNAAPSADTVPAEWLARTRSSAPAQHVVS